MNFFWAALTILFIGLKLGSVIDWSWWLVLAPLWVWLVVVTLYVIAMLAASGHTKDRRR